MERSRWRRRGAATLGTGLVFVLLATLLPAAGVIAASDEGLCPADYTRPQAATPRTQEPAPTPTPEPPLKGPPPSSGEARAGATPEPPPTDISLGDKWRKLPRSPFAARNAVAVWAGDRMVAFDPWRGRTATYFPPTRRWEEHQRMPGKSDTPGRVLDVVSLAAPAGDEVIVLGRRLADEFDVAAEYAFDPALGRWRGIAPSPLDGVSESAWIRESAWTGDLLLVGSRDRKMAAYDPVADCWLRLPELPLPELPQNARTWRAME